MHRSAALRLVAKQVEDLPRGVTAARVSEPTRFLLVPSRRLSPSSAHGECAHHLLWQSCAHIAEVGREVTERAHLRLAARSHEAVRCRVLRSPRTCTRRSERPFSKRKRAVSTAHRVLRWLSGQLLGAAKPRNRATVDTDETYRLGGQGYYLLLLRSS